MERLPAEQKYAKAGFSMPGEDLLIAVYYPAHDYQAVILVKKR
jgi:hypothetical protein